jgi:DNA-binding FadR family transcriptional regulator
MQDRQQQRRDTDPADRDFHLGIARATHNSVLVSVVEDLWDRGRGAIWRRMEHHFQTPELRSAALRDHRAILEALEARDSRASRAAMRRHLERVDREFSHGWELLKEREAESTAAAASVVPAPRRAAPPRSR